MPRNPRREPPAGIDPFTVDTLMAMIRYFPDDERIAKHLGLSVSRVRQARARLPGNHRMSSRNVQRAKVIAEVRKQVEASNANDQ